MKFTCEKLTLTEAIADCLHAVTSKSSITALEGLLIKAMNDRVTLTSYNFKTAITKSFETTVYREGAYIINARMLYDIVRRLPDDIVEIDVEEGYKTTIKSGLSEYNIMASDENEFPELPECIKLKSVTVKNADLKDAIEGTVFSVSDNETKPIHTGCLFEIDGENLTVVAVDGYRLAIRREKILSENGEAMKFVVPGETLKDILRLLPEGEDETTTIYPDRKHAIFETGGTVVVTRLLEGEFLDYMRAIPQNFAAQLDINVKALKDSIERVSLIISERLKNPIRCAFFDSSVKISCITVLGRAFDECPISFCPDKIEIGFNNKYILDALKACDDENVVLYLTDGVSPAVIKPKEGDKYVYMVLPVRLKHS